MWIIFTIAKIRTKKQWNLSFRYLQSIRARTTWTTFRSLQSFGSGFTSSTRSPSFSLSVQGHDDHDVQQVDSIMTLKKQSKSYWLTLNPEVPAEPSSPASPWSHHSKYFIHWSLQKYSVWLYLIRKTYSKQEYVLSDLFTHLSSWFTRITRWARHSGQTLKNTHARINKHVHA